MPCPLQAKRAILCPRDVRVFDLGDLGRRADLQGLFGSSLPGSVECIVFVIGARDNIFCYAELPHRFFRTSLPSRFSFFSFSSMITFLMINCFEMFVVVVVVVVVARCCCLNRVKLPFLPVSFSSISAFAVFLALSRSFIICSRIDASPRTLAPIEALFCFAEPPHRASKANSLKIAS